MIDGDGKAWLLLPLLTSLCCHLAWFDPSPPALDYLPLSSGKKNSYTPPPPPHLWLAWRLLGVPLADLRCWWAQVMLYEEVVLQGSWWAGQRGQHTRASVRGLDGLQPGCHVDIYDWFLCAVHTPKAYCVLLS